MLGDLFHLSVGLTCGASVNTKLRKLAEATHWYIAPDTGNNTDFGWGKRRVLRFSGIGGTEILNVDIFELLTSVIL